jgi:hypothetical protein
LTTIKDRLERDNQGRAPGTQRRKTYRDDGTGKWENNASLHAYRKKRDKKRKEAKKRRNG